MPLEKLTKIRVTEIMDIHYQKVHPDTTLSEAIGIMLKYKQFELPVVAKNGVLRGLLSYSSLARTGRVTMNEKVETHQMSVPRLRVGDSVERAAELLISSDHRLLPVTKNRKVQGVVRRWKIIELSSDLETWKGMKVTELMHQPVEVVRVHDRLTTARNKLRRLDIRTIPVVDKNGELAGIIGIQDIVSYLRPKRRAQLGNFSGEKIHFDPEVKDVMIGEPHHVSENATVSTVITIMLDKSISSVVVVKERRPVGVVTRFDILEHIVSAGRKQEGVFVNISGLEEEDPDVLETLFEILDSAMNRINKIFPPKVLNIHVHTYNDEGNEAKYSVHMRLTTDKYLFLTKTVDWDIFRAFAEAADQIYTQVIKKKELVKNHKVK
ncbi:MAG: CBS domain-containing protein [Thermoplasmata archaeon]|nr:CBS domain-containing protein [Thermoplasmata archaeon]